ncbi:MAG TPA: glycogen debranching protein [Deltaproteobacteria bacterium]|nr:glycogen debranching protein [Deltaproteobacteria bacterium]
MCGLAALASSDPVLIAALEDTLDTLARHQGPVGQIPSNVGEGSVSYGGRAGRVDASTWWLVAVGIAHRITGDDDRLRARWPAVERAIGALRAWEINDGGLLYVPTAGDWADEFPVSGYLLMDNALYRWALLELHAAAARAGLPVPALAREPDAVVLERLWGGDAYHAGLEPSGPLPWFDALGNALALLLDPSGPHRDALLAAAWSRLDHDLIPAFDPPIRPGDPGWPRLVALAAHGFRNAPGRYHNGGLWPMNAGFWAIAARCAGDERIADRLLAGIRAANAHGFPEYLEAGTGAPGGVRGQGWSAAAEILASPRGRVVAPG